MFQDNSCCSIINQNTPIQTDRQLAANAHPVQRCEANEIHQEKEISLPYPWPDAAGEGNENIVLPSTASADSVSKKQRQLAVYVQLKWFNCTHLLTTAGRLLRYIQDPGDQPAV